VKDPTRSLPLGLDVWYVMLDAQGGRKERSRASWHGCRCKAKVLSSLLPRKKGVVFLWKKLLYETRTVDVLVMEQRRSVVASRLSRTPKWWTSFKDQNHIRRSTTFSRAHGQPRSHGQYFLQTVNSLMHVLPHVNPQLGTLLQLTHNRARTCIMIQIVKEIGNA
jgi:hypothetical protein